MTALGFALFDTPVGRCGIAWDRDVIVGLQLPESSVEKTRARLSRRFTDAVEMPPPSALSNVIARIVALLSGEATDFSDVALDMDNVPPFAKQVYELARTIPPGKTLTYGDIATRLGDRLAARDVGEALGKNPFPIVIPCHRVVAANGKLGGFSARGGAETKRKLLAIEKAEAAGQPELFDSV
jgi:methylated-DNA-[protein]-cysteine S-methyltransferase